MRLIVAGGRSQHMSAPDYRALERLCRRLRVSLIVTGGARGVDADAAEWARKRGYATATYLADWGAFGPRAGAIRNQLMAENADAVVLFPGGPGTANMRNAAARVRLQIFDWRGPPETEERTQV